MWTVVNINLAYSIFKTRLLYSPRILYLLEIMVLISLPFCPPLNVNKLKASKNPIKKLTLYQFAGTSSGEDPPGTLEVKMP